MVGGSFALCQSITYGFPVATYNSSNSTCQTATGSVVDTISLAAYLGAVEVVNVNGVGVVSFTTDGTTPPVSPPNNEMNVVPAAVGAGLVVPATRVAGAGTVVKLISTGATQYSVTAVSQ